MPDKTNRLTSVPKAFVNTVEQLEAKIMKSIEELVSNLSTSGGNFILDEKNMALIESLNQRMKDVIFTEEYEKGLTNFIKEFKTQAALTNEYFQTLDASFDIKPVYESVLKSTQRNAIELLSEDAFTQALNLPLKQALESSITNKQPFNELMESLRVIIRGDDTIDGRLISHVKRVAYDSFSVSDRAYTNTIAVDLGLEFYRYSGGSVDETRCFCEQRKGKYFHREEIKAWGRKENLGECSTGKGWAGMNTNTSESTIFFYAGGYSCKHSILPVSTKSVPREVIERAIAAGYYQEAA